MNLGEMRTYVRDTVGCDAELISDFMLDSWFQEGSDRVHRFTEWPWQDTTWTLSTAEQYVDFGDIVDESGAVPKHIRFVHNGDDKLEYWDSQELITKIFQESDVTGEPLYWSQRGARTLILHPAPETAEGYLIIGQRAPLDWISKGASSEPDCPDALQRAIVFWGMANAYQMLEDGQTASHFFERSQLTLGEEKDNYRYTEFGEESIMGGRTYSPRFLNPPTIRIVT